MAPEQFHGKAVFASDVYSIGVTMYQLLTGRLPYESPTPADLDKLERGELTTSPRLHNPKLPKAISDIVLKAMAPEIPARYPRAHDLLDAILAARPHAGGRRPWPAAAGRDRRAASRPRTSASACGPARPRLGGSAGTAASRCTPGPAPVRSAAKPSKPGPAAAGGRRRRYVSPSGPRYARAGRACYGHQPAAQARDRAGASDVHLKVGNFPVVRVNGQLRPLTEDIRLDHEALVDMAATIMSANQRQRFKDAQELDLAYSVRRAGPLPLQRLPAARHHRHRPARHPAGRAPLRGARPAAGAAHHRRGTARPGAGHRHHRQRQEHHAGGDGRLHQPEPRDSHIITIEDPIEYLHRDHKSILNQREIGSDTRSFAHALRSALRQDPDVILVGEMRDMETIETALHAAETGHLVFSTLHTLDATETINRVISVFPPHQQKQVRLQLASVLKAAVAQRLIPRADLSARVPGRGGAHRHAVRARLHRRQGEDAPHQGRHRAGHVAVRDADLRPVDLQPLLAGPGHLRGGAALGVERRRVQAQDPGHLDHRRACRATRWPARSWAASR